MTSVYNMNTYQCSPNTIRSTNGFISVCISDTAETNNIRDKVTNEFCRTWAQSCGGRPHITYAASLHYQSTAVSRDHFHFLYWHSRDCAATRYLWNISKTNGWRFTWCPVQCVSCALEYILRGAGDKLPICSKTKFAPTCKGHLPLDSVPQDYVPRYRNGQPTCFDEPTERDDNPSSGGQANNTPSRRPSTSSAVPTLSKREERSIEKVSWIRQLILKYGITDFNQFQTAVMLHETSDVVDQLVLGLLNTNFKKTVMNSINLCKVVYKNTPWSILIQKLAGAPQILELQTCEPMASIEDSKYFLAYWCKIQNLDLDTFVRDVTKVMNRSNPKFNMIYLYGQSNSFKSKILMSIARSSIYFSVINNLDRNTMRFAFSGSINSRCIVLEEVRGCDETHDYLKAILGGDSLVTDVKFEDHQRIDRIPILASSNLPMWSGCTQRTMGSFSQALQARGFIHDCKRVPSGEHFNGGMHPLMWEDPPTNAIYEAPGYQRFVVLLTNGEQVGIRRVQDDAASIIVTNDDDASNNGDCQLDWGSNSMFEDIDIDEITSQANLQSIEVIGASPEPPTESSPPRYQLFFNGSQSERMSLAHLWNQGE